MVLFCVPQELWEDVYKRQDSSVISALLSGGLALIGTFGGILAGNKLTTYRISELEKKVDKHNNLVAVSYTHLDVYKRQLLLR